MRRKIISMGWTILTELDEAMLARMKEIVYTEHRPFSYMDFVESFTVNGREYHIDHGTFRNKILILRKQGIIELEYNSKVCFYTLTGVRFGSTVTRNHMGVLPVISVTGVMGNEMEDLLNYLKTIPVEEASVHDIHYKFAVPISIRLCRPIGLTIDSPIR